MPKRKQTRGAQSLPVRKPWAEAQLAERRRVLLSLEEGKASPEALEAARAEVQSWENIVRNWVD